MRSSLFFFKQPDKLIDDDFLQEAVKTHTTAAGFAVVKNGQVVGDTFDPSEKDLLDAIMKTSEAYKDQKVFFHMSNAGDVEFTGDSMQPFAIIKKNDRVLLSAILAGEFTDFVREEETPEYHFLNEYLAEKLRAMYKANNNDMNKLMLACAEPIVKKELLPFLRPSGLICLIPAFGKTVAFHEAMKNSVEYTWGYASNGFGIPTDIKTKEPEVEDEPKVEIEKTSAPLTLAEKAARKKAMAAGVADPAPASKPTTVPEVPKKDDSTHVMPQDGVIGMKTVDGIQVPWCMPPKSQDGNNNFSEIKHWWNRNCVINRPSDAKDVLEGFPATALKSTSPIKAFFDKQQSGTPFRDAMDRAQEKINKTKTATAAVDNQPVPDKTEVVPGVLTADSKKIAVAIQVAAKDQSMSYDALELEQRLSEAPPYSEQVAVPFAEVCRWSDKAMSRLDKPSLLSINKELRLMIFKNNPILLDIVDESGAVEDKEPKKLSLAEKAALKKSKAA